MESQESNLNEKNSSTAVLENKDADLGSVDNHVIHWASLLLFFNSFFIT